MLEQANVAGRDGRRGEPNHLPERKIPRHHGEHHADRLECDEAALARDVDGFVGEKARRVVGVEAAAARAFRRLFDRRA